MSDVSDMATVVGGRGFIGRSLVERLRKLGYRVVVPNRDEQPRSAPGHVFFCAGLTADFRHRLHDTMTAHVSLAQHWLQQCDFESFTYLSSTRVYAGQTSGREDQPICVSSLDPSDFYNISKLAGEALVVTDTRATARVVRLSNIFDADDTSVNFLTLIVRDAIHKRRVHIDAGPVAAKDYLSLDSAVAAIARVPFRAQSRLINVASGIMVRNDTIGALLTSHVGAEVTYGSGQSASFPIIDTVRLRGELGIEPEDFEGAFTAMLRGLM